MVRTYARARVVGETHRIRTYVGARVRVRYVCVTVPPYRGDPIDTPPVWHIAGPPFYFTAVPFSTAPGAHARSREYLVGGGGGGGGREERAHPVSLSVAFFPHRNTLLALFTAFSAFPFAATAIRARTSPELYSDSGEEAEERSLEVLSRTIASDKDVFYNGRRMFSDGGMTILVGKGFSVAPNDSGENVGIKRITRHAIRTTYTSLLLIRRTVRRFTATVMARSVYTVV